MTRKVLMISHGYPPVGGSGMLRTLKFSKYLPPLGWQPVVLTLQRTKHPRLDTRLLKEVPAGTAVYRSPVWNPLDLLVWLKSLPKRLRRTRPAAPGAGGGGGVAEPATDDAPRGGPMGLLLDLLTTPDSYSGWLGPGLCIGLWTLLRRPEALARSRRDRLRQRPQGLANSLRGMGAGAQPPLHDRLDRIAVPVLLVVGEEDAKFRGIAEELRRLLADARIAILPDAGHAAHLEAPAAFAACVSHFLDDVDAGREERS